ncbi:MAG: Methylated-DNA--protein-cysteine methyltransferase [Verrucomicrobiota bacterium]
MIFHGTSLSTPIGQICLAVDERGAIAALAVEGTRSLASFLPPAAVITPHPTRSKAAVAELRAYFAGELRAFTLPIAPATGTPFQRRIWQALSRIPYGVTWSYARLAAETGSVARAAGQANGANPLCIVVPCHRVIAADGTLGGYSGGLDRKRWLLRHEGALLA